MFSSLARPGSSDGLSSKSSRRQDIPPREALALMLSLAEEIDTARAEAVKDLRGHGYSWAEIGARLGITRQAAQQRWGQP